MKKIVAFIGSKKGEHSNTVKFTKMILDKIVELSKAEVSYEIKFSDVLSRRKILNLTELNDNMNKIDLFQIVIGIEHEKL